MSAAPRQAVTWPAWPAAVAEPVSPAVLLRCPCELGSCEACHAGKHSECPDLRGVRHGSPYFLEHGTRTTLYSAQPHRRPLAPVYADGTHQWHCLCDRHDHGGALAPVQLDIFDALEALA